MTSRAITLFVVQFLIALTHMPLADAAGWSSRQADSESIKGKVGFRGVEPYILLQTQTDPEPRPYPLQATSAALNSDLRRLSTGDLIIGTGVIERVAPGAVNGMRHGRVILNAIDTVGLKQILGHWRTPKWQVFEFRDFHHLNLYRAPSASTRSIAPHQMTYTLAPAGGDPNLWSIFMADKKGIHIGSLAIGEKSLRLTLFDPESGQVKEELELSPFRVQ